MVSPLMALTRITALPTIARRSTPTVHGITSLATLARTLTATTPAPDAAGLLHGGFVGSLGLLFEDS